VACFQYAKTQRSDQLLIFSHVFLMIICIPVSISLLGAGCDRSATSFLLKMGKLEGKNIHFLMMVEDCNLFLTSCFFYSLVEYVSIAKFLFDYTLYSILDVLFLNDVMQIAVWHQFFSTELYCKMI